MGVYIKNIKISENCTRCDYIGLNVAIGCPVMSGTKGRATDCPLVEIPENHGRLIDADADGLKYRLKFVNEAERQIRESWRFTEKCIYAIDDAPTVIEAEDSE